jgi:teichuronic acid exporter
VDDSLKSKAFHALLWSFLESVGVRGVQFIIGIMLARMLMPEQFGLIGMLTIFMSLAQSFLDSGFGAALIQKRETNQTDVSSIFYFNIVVGITAAGLMCIAAPWIAAFFNQPILMPVTRVLSLTIVINSFGLIQNTMITKQINFKTLTKVSLTAGIISGIIGVILAANGFGVWSLVVQQVSGAFLVTIFLWFLNTWRPSLVFSISSLRKMFGFGSRVLASGLISAIFDNIYLFAIGKLFSAAELGFFTRAKQFGEFPSLQLTWMVGRVSFPVFSTIKDEPVRLKRGLKKALTTLVLVNFPMMIGIMVMARPLVIALLTEKWAPCIPYLRLLCLVCLLFPLNWLNVNVLLAMGRSDLSLRLEVIKRVLIVFNITVTWWWGIKAMLCGQIVISIISYCLNSYYNGVLANYPVKEQLLDLSSYLIAAIFMGLVVFGIDWLMSSNVWFLLFVQVIAGLFIYVGLCWLFQLPAFLEMWRIGSRKLQLLTTSIA